MMDKINRHINFMDAMKSERSFSGPDKKKSELVQKAEQCV